MEKVRLNKYLATMGVESRRRCDILIEKGLVKVNGKVVTQLGTKVDPSIDKVVVDSQKVNAIKKSYEVIVLNKPRGYVCTRVKGEGHNIYELIESYGEDMVPAGRLDKKSEGLLIMSNDGDLIFKLTHPKFGKTKVYHVMISGGFSEAILKRLNRSMMIDGYKTQPAKVKIIRGGEKEGRLLLEFRLKEGRNHQIRKMCDQCGLKVHRLVRISVQNISLGGLRPGQWRPLTPKEIKILKS